MARMRRQRGLWRGLWSIPIPPVFSISHVLLVGFPPGTAVPPVPLRSLIAQVTDRVGQEVPVPRLDVWTWTRPLMHEREYSHRAPNTAVHQLGWHPLTRLMPSWVSNAVPQLLLG
jgi:hypothetical protein